MLNGVTKGGPCAPLFYSVIALLLSGNFANAQAVDVATLEECAELESQALKLACFEAIIADGRSADSAAASPDVPDLAEDPAPVVAVEKAPLIEIDERPEVSVAVEETVASPVTSAASAPATVATEAAPMESSTRTMTTTTAPITSEPAAVADLGSEQIESRNNPNQNVSIQATVVDVSKGYNRDLRFHLANGQVWRQIEPRHFEYPKNQEFDIEISRGLLGAYRMRIGEKGRMIKIRRIQ